MERTVPELARALEVSSDLLRKFLARRPDLRDSGRLVGPMRLYTAEQSRVIRAAFESRGDGRKRSVKEAEVV